MYKSGSVLFVLVVIIIVVVIVYFYKQHKVEGYYDNTTGYYTGCNPLLVTNCGGCKGCGFKVPSCWRESELCGIQKACF